MLHAPEPFDLLGPLPENTTVLEASAGTGKTFTIANLVARYVAEGVATMEQLLVVSFSRESTRELRERVRERLVSARDGLADLAHIPSDDRVLALLADASPAEAAVRRQRLAEALSVFDAATVTTTHGFCQQVLVALGTAGDHDVGATLVESVDDLVTEVADDLYLRKWGRRGAEPPGLKREPFRELARAAAKDPATDLLPLVDKESPDTDTPMLRARIAAAVRSEVDRRKRRQHLVDYDDMLIRLADTLTDDTSGPVAKARLRGRYRVVLVDEFQDTDPVQWTILREAFHGHSTLVLIGDPKQAIYAFRGADVHAYLDAREVAGVVHTLSTNHRSDVGLLAGMSAVLGGAALGDPRITVLPVEAAHSGPMVSLSLSLSPSVSLSPPLQLRVLSRGQKALTTKGLLSVGDARTAVARDLADRVVTMLSDNSTLQPRDRLPPRPLEPRDIAVLVRSYLQADLVQAALRAANVPVVLTGKSSVFATPAAREWQLLLEALEQPHRTTRVRRLALSSIVGLDASSLDAAGDTATDDLAMALRSWAAVLEVRGVAAMFEAVSLRQHVQPRILGQVDGERLLTDLRHIGEVLHEAALEGQLGPTALLVWLRRRISAAAGEGGQERSRRLDTDAAAVQVITVHTSKGLEFPVVLVPFAWDLYARPDPSTAVFHEGARRVRDVGGPGSPDWRTHVSAHRQEETDDELRLTYVALTRAQARLEVWWAPSSNTATSPLHRLLMHDPSSGGVAPQAMPVPDDATALAHFRALAAVSNGGMDVVTVPETTQSAPWAPPAAASQQLDVARFDRTLDVGWRRTSYSALTSSAHEARLGSEPEVAQQDDETDVESGVESDVDLAGNERTPADRGLRDVVSVWDALPAGAAFGTLVHSVLERFDGDSDPLEDVVRTQVARLAPEVDAAALTTGLRAALTTPLGALADDAALIDVPTRDRLSELDFELPLAVATTRITRASDALTWCCVMSCRCGARTCPPALCRRTPMCWPSCPTWCCVATSPAASTQCFAWERRPCRAIS